MSGGHSSYFLLAGQAATPLNRTRDDAAGEVFDKVAAALGLGYPGGPVVDRLADLGDAAGVHLLAPRIKDPTGALDFSFSGLKTMTIRSAPERLLPLPDPARAAAGGARPAGLLPPHHRGLAARAAATSCVARHRPGSWRPPGASRPTASCGGG